MCESRSRWREAGGRGHAGQERPGVLGEPPRRSAPQRPASRGRCDGKVCCAGSQARGARLEDAAERHLPTREEARGHGGRGGRGGRGCAQCSQPKPGSPEPTPRPRPTPRALDGASWGLRAAPGRRGAAAHPQGPHTSLPRSLHPRLRLLKVRKRRWHPSLQRPYRDRLLVTRPLRRKSPGRAVTRLQSLSLKVPARPRPSSPGSSSQPAGASHLPPHSQGN